MRSIVNGTRYNTTTATTIYEWMGISLCRSMDKRNLFLHYHCDGKTEYIEPISRDDAVFMLQAKGDPQAIALLYDQAG
ncbi:hypothetical protein ACFL3F_00095 [Planctomycetota bacterium]